MSFTANFFCRICTLSREETHKVCSELFSKLRTIENYNIHLNMNDRSRTGIKGDCIFNQLPYWHCVLNKVIEIMHDFFEGTNKYVLCKAFVKWIDQKILSLEELNRCVKLLEFDLGKLKEDSLPMTARESWQFLYLLPICLGDKIPHGDPSWELILILIEITETILGSSFYECTLSSLERLIQNFGRKYQNLFGTLKQ